MQSLEPAQPSAVEAAFSPTEQQAKCTTDRKPHKTPQRAAVAQAQLTTKQPAIAQALAPTQPPPVAAALEPALAPSIWPAEQTSQRPAHSRADGAPHALPRQARAHEPVGRLARGRRSGALRILQLDSLGRRQGPPRKLVPLWRPHSCFRAHPNPRSLAHVEAAPAPAPGHV